MFLLIGLKLTKCRPNPDTFQVLAVGKKTFDKNMKKTEVSTLKSG
jgi:hypothetical protein